MLINDEGYNFFKHTIEENLENDSEKLYSMEIFALKYRLEGDRNCYPIVHCAGESIVMSMSSCQAP